MPVMKLVITHDTETNQIRLDGPLDMEMYCYGLLKKAEIAIADRAKKSQKSSGRIVVPTLIAPGT